MKPDTYKLIEMCVESGVAYGIHRAYKHTENPDRDYMQDKIMEAVMSEICQWFKFDPVDES